MKANIYIIVLFLFSFSTKSQISAGDSTSAGIYYQNLSSIYVVCPFQCSNFYFCDSTYGFDVNQDAVNDIEFYHYNVNQPGVCSYYERVNLLNSNIQLVVIPTDSGYIDSIKVGTLIDKTKKWRQSQSSCLYLHWYAMTTGTQVNGVFDNLERYFGFRIIEPTDTLYGYFRVSLQYSSGGIEGISVNSFAINKYTNGVKTDNDHQYVGIFPIPTTNNLIFHSNIELGSIKINDALGQFVFEMKNKNKQEQIDITNLQNGIYFVQVKTSEGVLTKKIVVQR